MSEDEQMDLHELLKHIHAENMNRCDAEWDSDAEPEDPDTVSGWRYGLILKESSKGSELALHEIFFSSKKGIEDASKLGWTENPIDFMGDTKSEIIKQLEMALKDVKASKIIRVNEEGDIIEFLDERESDGLQS